MGKGGLGGWEIGEGACGRWNEAPCEGCRILIFGIVRIYFSRLGCDRIFFSYFFLVPSKVRKNRKRQ